MQESAAASQRKGYDLVTVGFDSGKSNIYHRSIMPGSLFAWYSLYDLEVLAERKAVLSGEIELRELTRLRELLHSDRGSVQASLTFHRQANFPVTVDLEFETVLELACQRCLDPLVHSVFEQVSVTLLEPESGQSEVVKESEAAFLLDRKLRPVSLLEDELIVSLPIIPRHEKIDECGYVAQAVEAFAPENLPGNMDLPLRNR